MPTRRYVLAAGAAGILSATGVVPQARAQPVLVDELQPIGDMRPQHIGTLEGRQVGQQVRPVLVLDEQLG